MRKMEKNLQVTNKNPLSVDVKQKGFVAIQVSHHLLIQSMDKNVYAA